MFTPFLYQLKPTQGQQVVLCFSVNSCDDLTVLHCVTHRLILVQDRRDFLVVFLVLGNEFVVPANGDQFNWRALQKRASAVGKIR